MKIYLAYGSNTNSNSMMKRCPEAEFKGIGKIKGWKLNFRGIDGNSYATIEPESNSILDVTVWFISENDEKNLDYYEGFPSLYSKNEIQFETENCRLNGMIYIMNAGRNIALPSKIYFDEILEGYAENDMDTEPLFDAMFRCK